jgi:hypothetical protein
MQAEGNPMTMSMVLWCLPLSVCAAHLHNRTLPERATHALQVVLQHQEIDVNNTADVLMNARKVVIVPGGLCKQFDHRVVRAQ